MRIALLLFCLFCTACVPVVQHGPWVRPGMSGNVGASAVAVNDTDPGGDFAPLISFEGGMRWGLVANDSTSNGVSLGFNIPLLALLIIGDADDSDGFLQFVHLDGYVAIPVTKTLNGSFGITGSKYHTMPYAQLGKYDAWYTTQAVMLIAEEDAWLWAPSFTWVQPSRGATRTHLTLTGSLGSNGDESLWMVGFSIIFEFARARN